MEDTEGVVGTSGGGEMTDAYWRIALICIMFMYKQSFIAMSFWLTSGLSFIRDTNVVMNVVLTKVQLRNSID